MGGKLLRQWMESEGLSQVEAAQRLGVSQPHVSDLLGSRRRPSLELAARIESATGGAVPAVSWVQGEAAA